MLLDKIFDEICNGFPSPISLYRASPVFNLYPSFFKSVITCRKKKFNPIKASFKIFFPAISGINPRLTVRSLSAVFGLNRQMLLFVALHHQVSPENSSPISDNTLQSLSVRKISEKRPRWTSPALPVRFFSVNWT